MAQLQSPPEPPSDAERIAALQARNAELELELQQIEERVCKQSEASTDKTERRESQQLLQGILDTAPVGIFLKNLQGQYILLNPYWLSTMGLSQEQALGKTDYDLFVPEIASEIAKRERAVLDAGGAVTYEEVIPNPDKTRPYITKRFPLYAVAGNPYAVCGISTDISDRKRMEEELRQSEERFSKAFRVNPAATTITTLAEGRYIDVNDSFLRLSGFHREEVIGKTSIELGIWVRDRAHVMGQVIQQLQHQPIYELEVKYRNKSGEIRDGI